MNLPQSAHSAPQPQRLEPVPPAWSYPPPYFYGSEEEEINLLDYWRVIMRRKWQIVLTTLLITALTLAVSLWLPKKYKAEVSLMPLTSSGGGGGLSSMVSQFSSLPLVGGALGDLSKMGGGKSKELVNILKSRTLSEKMINQFDLMKVFFKKQWDVQNKIFQPNWRGKIPVMEDGVSIFQKGITKIEEDKKSGLVKIQVTMTDPVLGAKIANAMVLALQEFINNNSLTVAKRNRIFIEEQLVKIKTKLLEAGKELNQFYAENKISSVVPQLDVDVGTYQIVPKPFEEFREDIDQLNNQQKEAEEAKKSSHVQRVPGQVYLQFLTLNRELLSKTFAMLTQQYELSKIEEAKEDLAFQVIDKAEVKVRHDSPKLKLNVAIGFVGGFFIAVFIAFFREYIDRLREKEKNK